MRFFPLRGVSDDFYATVCAFAFILLSSFMVRGCDQLIPAIHWKDGSLVSSNE